MKFISTILTIALLSVATWTADAQSNITLSLDNVSIEQAIDQIEQESSYSFLVADKTVDLGKRVSINVRNTEIDAVLDIILKDSGIRYKIIDRQIILSPQSADTYTLTGTVTDSHGEPVIGAYIVDKDSGEGVISDNNGAYSITVGPDALLEISYLGFATQQIQLTGQRKLNVTMREDRETLDEVVVVGYGTQKRRDLTGSISSVSMDDEPVNSINSVGHMLAGKAAGLYVTQSSAQPGAGVKIRIRGEASTGAGNDALIIVDGMPISDSGNLGNGTAYVNGSTDNMLSFINPNDIATERVPATVSSSSPPREGRKARQGCSIRATSQCRLWHSHTKCSMERTI